VELSSRQRWWSLQTVTASITQRWGNFPRERQRLFDLNRERGAGGVTVLSGDRHIGGSTASGAANFGTVDIDWWARGVILFLRSVNGEPARRLSVNRRAWSQCTLKQYHGRADVSSRRASAERRCLAT
jgi:hypothetical protein